MQCEFLLISNVWYSRVSEWKMDLGLNCWLWYKFLIEICELRLTGMSVVYVGEASGLEEAGWGFVIGFNHEPVSFSMQFCFD